MGIALISGASRGIGRATALLLAQEGYTVAVNYHHNINAATEVVNTIVASGGKATALRADISDEAQVMAMFEAIDRMGEPLTALLARRDCLSGRIRQLRDFLACASANVSRGTRAEIRVVSTVNVKEYQKRADDLARDLRELDVKIQSLNWTTDLMEA